MKNLKAVFMLWVLSMLVLAVLVGYPFNFVFAWVGLMIAGLFYLSYRALKQRKERQRRGKW